MAKATKRKADEVTEPRKKRASRAGAKPAATKRKAAAKKPAAVKKAVRKAVAKKKPAVVKRVKPTVKATVKAKKAATKAKTSAKSRARKSATRPTVEATKTSAPRARRVRNAVLEVSPEVIDTTSAAEVAARLVVDGAGHGDVPHLGNIFTPPPAVGLKRGSSALRHVKEMLHRPVASQLESVFGPAPVPPETMRRFLKGEKVARTQRVRGGTSFHAGQPTVPHRSVG
jgi:hypothetical protein